MSVFGKRILIVEDNTLNRVVYRITLGVGGAYLVFDRWGDEAIQRLKRSEQWDLIILDLMLSRGVSGYDVFEEIRSMPEYNHIPILAISASEPGEAIPKTRELGFNGFICKPINEDVFVDQVARVMDGEEIWDDAMFGRL